MKTNCLKTFVPILFSGFLLSIPLAVNASPFDEVAKMKLANKKTQERIDEIENNLKELEETVLRSEFAHKEAMRILSNFDCEISIKESSLLSHQVNRFEEQMGNVKRIADEMCQLSSDCSAINKKRDESLNELSSRKDKLQATIRKLNTKINECKNKGE